MYPSSASIVKMTQLFIGIVIIKVPLPKTASDKVPPSTPFPHLRYTFHYYSLLLARFLFTVCISTNRTTQTRNKNEIK